MKYMYEKKYFNFFKTFIFIIILFKIFIIFNSCKDKITERENNANFYLFLEKRLKENLDENKIKNYEIEPNNSYKNSNEISFLKNIYGNLDYEEDIDFYFIKNYDSLNILNLQLILNDANFNDLLIEFYDENLNFITKNEPNKLTLLKVYPLEKIYIKIYSKNNEKSTFLYNLVIIFDNNEKFSEIEPNNSFQKANELNHDTLYKGNINNEHDIFSISFEKAKFINFNLKINEGRLNLVFYDEFQNVIYEKNNLSKGGVLFPILFEKGKYYIKLYGEFSNYEISFSNAAFNGEIEFNDNFENANYILSNNFISGALSFEKDIDFYYFEVNKNYITIKFKKETYDKIVLEIYDFEKKLIYSFNIDENYFEKKIFLENGKYYIKIYRDISFNNLFYELGVEIK
jgi:hypothetical protein